jgi:hypothetical protein
MAQIVTTSEEYKALVAQHTDAWMRLRTVKEALRTVQSGLHGQLPQRWADEAFRSEPLEIRVGYPVDLQLVTAWQTALAALEQDADAELPDDT